MDSNAGLTEYGYRWTFGEKNMIYIDDESIESQFFLLQQPRIRSKSRPKVKPSRLESLPLEILQQILLSVNPGVTTSLRLLSSRLADSVDGLFPLQQLLSFAPQLLLALAKTHFIRRYSIARLYATLRSDRCEYCDNYAPYVYLLRCERVCYRCLRYDQRTSSTFPATAKKLFGITSSNAKLLPKLSVVPGKYASGKDHWITTVDYKLPLVSVQSAYELADQPKEKEKDVQDFVKNHQNGKPLRDHKRFMCYASVAVPYLDSLKPVQSNTVQHGIWCRGCEFEYERHRFDLIEGYFDRLERAFSKDEFIEHCKGCFGIKELKRGAHEREHHLLLWRG